MSRYVGESIGYNDGLPYARFVTNNLEAAKAKLDFYETDQLRVSHRLIEIIEERVALVID